MTEISWKALVDEAERDAQGRKIKEKDVAYRFSGGREFERKEDPYEDN